MFLCNLSFFNQRPKYQLRLTSNQQQATFNSVKCIIIIIFIILDFQKSMELTCKPFHETELLPDLHYFPDIFCNFFLTNILGSINPNVSDSYSLSGTMTGMLPFSFFIAYGLMSIPAGMIIQKYREKKSLVLAWILSFPVHCYFLFSLFFPVFLLFAFSYRMRDGYPAGSNLSASQSFRRRREFCI